MTYTQARLIVWNHEAYEGPTVRKAAVFILASLAANSEDIDQASSLL